MKQQQQQNEQSDHSWRTPVYTIAKWALTITTWIWASLIIAFLIQFIPNWLFADRTDNWKTTIQWLQSTAPPGSFLRLLVEIVAVLLIIIPPLAWVLKRSLQKANLEGFDKLMNFLEQDAISPQLDALQTKFEQQLQTQDACIKALGRVCDLLQRTPTSSDLQGLYTLSQQQLSLQKELSLALQDIRTRTFEQVQWLGDLYEQDQHGQKAISVGLQNISDLLKQMRESPQALSLLSHQDDRSLPNRQKDTEPFPAVGSRAQTDQIASSFPEYTDNHNNTAMNT